MEARWYAAYTKHQHEKKSADLLSRKGLEVYLPLRDSVRQWQDRKKKISVPLFPSYVFLHSNLANKTEILNTPGIFFLVENAGHACAIPDQEIEFLRIATRSRQAMEEHPFVQVGERIGVRRGPLAGVQGVLTRVKNQHRVVLAIELLRKAVSVEIDVRDIERISDASARGGW